jgi:ParB-like chromosome segregation protein Spo0J
MIKKVKISEVKPNPNNPRLIKDDKFKKLVKSIQDFPDMLNVRPIVVNKDMVVIGGNMRLKAIKEAGHTEVAVEIVDWTEDQQKEFIVKDNVGYGEWDWDDLANNWDAQELTDWGLDIPDLQKIDKMEEHEVLHLEKSLQVLPKKEYILIMADEGSEEWENLKTIFKCQVVRQGGCSIGSTSDKATSGLERVFDFKTFKKRVLDEI